LAYTARECDAVPYAQAGNPLGSKQTTVNSMPSRFTYPFTATTVIARKLVPLLLFTLGIGLFAWAGKEFYAWQRPWIVLPSALLGLMAWLVAGYFFTLLPEIRTDESGLRARRMGLLWRRIAWQSVAGVKQTAQIDLLGWVESFYTVYAWRTLAGRRGNIRRSWHRRCKRAFRFSGHIRNAEQLLTLIQENVDRAAEDEPSREPNLR